MLAISASYLFNFEVEEVRQLNQQTIVGPIRDIESALQFTKLSKFGQMPYVLIINLTTTYLLQLESTEDWPKPFECRPLMIQGTCLVL